MANYHICIYTQTFPANTSKFEVKEGVLTLAGNTLPKTDANRLLDLKVLNGGSSTTGSLTIDKQTVSVSVEALDYRKELYKPGWIRLKLQLTSTQTVTVKAIKAQFTSCILDLKETSNESDSFMVAKNYYIFQVKPEFKSDGTTTSMYVTLTAYSPDKFLTLDQYSRTYTGKRFYQEQLTETVNAYKEKNSFQCFIALTDSAKNNLRHLGVTVTENEKQIFKEYILPYSVQYNESFHDFLVRIANRNGEFLYWENGVLQVGLPPLNTTPVQITTYESRSYENDLFDVDANTIPVRAESVFHKTTKDGSGDEEETQAIDVNSSMLYHSEVSNESYWATIHKDDYLTQGDLWGMYFPLPYLLNVATGYLNETSLMDIVLGLSEEMATTAIENAIKGSKNQTKFEKFFGKGNTEHYDAKNEYYTPFSSYVDKVTSVGKEFYHTIHLKENHMDQSKMQIDCVGTFYRIRLGDCFYVDDKTETFVPIVIGGSVKKEGKWDEKQQKTIYTFKDQLNFTAIPVQEQECYPTHSEKGWIRTSGPQTAYVLDAKDPFNLGRIRIRYLWTEAKDGSPWIRVSQPKASSDSGIFFLPEKEDEILVNYENGNVERPYMVGGLHSANITPYEGGTNQTITSLNGHQLAFKDGAASDFLAGVSPAFKTLSTFIPGFKDATKFGTEGNAAALGGGITLADSWGFYSISMSSNKRAISIDCPLGKVGINAFTGISISAPNGNVKIEGKNVTIKAGNKLAIQSGGNIQDPESSSLLSQFGNALLDKGKDMLKSYLCDLSLIRTILEVFLKPIDGTMRLSSKRYLCMQAGIGKAKIQNEKYVKSMSNAMYKKLIWRKVKDMVGNPYNVSIRNLDAFITSSITKMVKNYAGACTALNAYEKVRDTLGDAILDKANWENDVKAIVSESKENRVFAPCEAPKLELKVYTDYKTAMEDYEEKMKEYNQNVSSNPGQQAPVKPQEPPVPEAEFNKVRQEFYDSLKEGNVENLIEDLSEKNAIVDDYTQTILADQDYKNLYDACNVAEKSADDLLNARKTEKGVINRYAMVLLRRKLIYACLKSKMFEDLHVAPETELGTDFSDDKWEEMINSIVYTDKALGEEDTTIRSKAKEAVMGFVSEVTGFDGFLDQYVWDQADPGEILFSNDKQTMHFNGKNIEVFAKNRQLPIDDLKNVLMNIKY